LLLRITTISVLSKYYFCCQTGFLDLLFCSSGIYNCCDFYSVEWLLLSKICCITIAEFIVVDQAEYIYLFILFYILKDHIKFQNEA
jgi:hypothetical protein